jgi:hypothetical protein
MKRPGDKTPDPPGGRALERLRLFEGARRAPSDPEPELVRTPARRGKTTRTAKAGKTAKPVKTAKAASQARSAKHAKPKGRTR